MWMNGTGDVNRMEIEWCLEKYPSSRVMFGEIFINYLDTRNSGCFAPFFLAPAGGRRPLGPPQGGLWPPLRGLLPPPRGPSAPYPP